MISVNFSSSYHVSTVTGIFKVMAIAAAASKLQPVSI